MGVLKREVGFLVTVEHASNRLPPDCANLGLSASVLQSHIAWDPGALAIGRALSRSLRAPLLAGGWSRLLADLNRSETNRKIVPARSFGENVPGNQDLTHDEIRARIDAYWRPFREQARQHVEEIVGRGAFCVHLSVHTFTPVFEGRVRDLDLGFLFDPSRDAELEIAAETVPAWRAAGWAARRNAPYRGVNDGHTTALRRQFSNDEYAGLEIEANQRQLPDWPPIVDAVVRGIADVAKDAAGKGAQDKIE